MSTVKFNKIPSELRNIINDFGVTTLSTDSELYDAIKRINPDFSLQMEYQGIITNRRRYSNRLTDEEFLYRW